MSSRNDLKQWFEDFAEPTGAQFANFIDSFWHKTEDMIPIAKITNLVNALAGKADAASTAAAIANEALERGETDDDLQLQIDALALPAQVGNAGKYLQTDGAALSWAEVAGGGSAPLVSHTYAELAALKDADGLVPGQKYLLTDYSTKYLDPTTSALKEGAFEGIVLIAASTSAFFKQALSVNYPKDILEFDFADNLIAEIEEPRNGIITRRTDDALNEAPYDHRAVTFTIEGDEVPVFAAGCIGNKVLGIGLNVVTFDEECIGNVVGAGSANNRFKGPCIYNTLSPESENISLEQAWFNTFLGRNSNHLFTAGCSFNTITNCIGIVFDAGAGATHNTFKECSFEAGSMFMNGFNNNTFINFNGVFTPNTGGGFLRSTIKNVSGVFTVGSGFYNNDIDTVVTSFTAGSGCKWNKVFNVFEVNLGDYPESNEIRDVASLTATDGFAKNAVENCGTLTFGDYATLNKLKDVDSFTTGPSFIDNTVFGLNTGTVGDSFQYNRIFKSSGLITADYCQNNEISNCTNIGFANYCSSNTLVDRDNLNYPESTSFNRAPKTRNAADAINFNSNAVYAGVVGDITFDDVSDSNEFGAEILIIHNDAVEPTFHAAFIKLSGSAGYVTGANNYISCKYIDSATILYTIRQVA